MDLDNQATIKKLSEEYGSENLMVVLGMPTDGLKIAVETLTKGDPSWAGPLAGVSLGLPVYHVLEEEIRGLIPSQMYEEKLKMMEIVLDIEEIESTLSEMRTGNS